jgi:hypothetical protein
MCSVARCVSLGYLARQNLTSLSDFPDVHLREVDDALSRHPAVIPVGTKELINFSRCVDVAACLDKLRKLHAPKENCEPRKVTYVKHQLQRTLIGPSANTEFERLCKSREGEERIHEKRRVREWEYVGLIHR